MKNRFLFAWLLVVLVACQSEPEGRPDEYYLKAGDSLSAAAFQTIRGALQTAIADSGVEKAIRFCQLNALSLTHQLNTDSIKIERLAERYRNAQNQLTDESKAVWDTYKNKLIAGDLLQPVLVRAANRIDYYKPILLQPFCLTCHGKPNSNIPASLVATIDSLYPNDLAKGFSVGELRGLWQIRFELP